MFKSVEDPASGTRSRETNGKPKERKISVKSASGEPENGESNTAIIQKPVSAYFIQDKAAPSDTELIESKVPIRKNTLKKRSSIGNIYKTMLSFPTKCKNDKKMNTTVVREETDSAGTFSSCDSQTDTERSTIKKQPGAKNHIPSNAITTPVSVRTCTVKAIDTVSVSTATNPMTTQTIVMASAINTSIVQTEDRDAGPFDPPNCNDQGNMRLLPINTSNFNGSHQYKDVQYPLNQDQFNSTMVSHPYTGFNLTTPLQLAYNPPLGNVPNNNDAVLNMLSVINAKLTTIQEDVKSCRAIMLLIRQGMVKVNTWVFILRRYKWHIHAGSRKAKPK